MTTLAALTFHYSFQQRTTKDWIEAFDDTSIPCGPINNIKQVFEDPQVNSKLRCILFYVLRGTHSYAGYSIAGKIQKNGSGVGAHHSRKDTSTRLPSELFTWHLSHSLLLVVRPSNNYEGDYSRDSWLLCYYLQPQLYGRKWSVGFVISVLFGLTPPCTRILLPLAVIIFGWLCWLFIFWRMSYRGNKRFD